MRNASVSPAVNTMPDETSINILPSSLCRSVTDAQLITDNKAMRLFFRYDSEMEYYVLPNDNISSILLEQILQVSKAPKELLQRPLIDIKYIKANTKNKINPMVLRKTAQIKAARKIVYGAILCFIMFCITAVIGVYYADDFAFISIIGIIFLVLGFVIIGIVIMANARIKCIYLKKKHLIAVKPEPQILYEVREIIKTSNKSLEEYSLMWIIERHGRWLELALKLKG